MAEHPIRVLVWLNGRRRSVPRRVGSEAEALAALGLPSGLVVRRKATKELVTFEGGHVFEPGDRYEALDLSGGEEDEIDEALAGSDPEPWSRPADWWKG